MAGLSAWLSAGRGRPPLVPLERGNADAGQFPYLIIAVLAKQRERMTHLRLRIFLGPPVPVSRLLPRYAPPLLGALDDHVPFKFRETEHHRPEEPPYGGIVDGAHVQDPDADAFRVNLIDQFQPFASGPGKAVKLGHHERIARLEQADQLLQLRALGRAARAHLLKDLFRSRGLERDALGCERVSFSLIVNKKNIVV